VLNTVNLPNDEETLERLIDVSVRSFAGKVKDPFEREYLFVLEEPRTGAVIGTSMVIAQHGTYDAPHIYYEVSEREHYSASLDRHFRHKVLSIAYNYEGPTEIGGLVVDPPAPSGPEKPGKQLSYVRFLYIAMHRNSFRDRVLAELMPPLMPDGRSVLWECVGKRSPASPTPRRTSSAEEQGVHQGAVPLLGHLRDPLPRAGAAGGRAGRPADARGAADAGADRLPLRRARRPLRRGTALRVPHLGGDAHPQVPHRTGRSRRTSPSTSPRTCW
jgi:hypothetical protein